MSNEIDLTINEDTVIERIDDLAAASKPTFKVKPVIPVIEKPAPVDARQAGEDVVKEAEAAQEKFRINARTAGSIKDGVATLDSLKLKKEAEVTDFSRMTEEDVYNLTIPMTARPFSSEDSLKAVLTDSGYIARWVNKDPRRLGAMIARGFSYVTDKDLRERLEVEVSADAEGHYSLGDVILMKISKERYYTALRAAHLRAVNSVGTKNAHKAAINTASEYMGKETGGQYNEEATAGKIAFYSPNVNI